MSVAPPHAPVWTVAPRRADVEERLQTELGVPALVAAVLAVRGLDDAESAKKFLEPKLEDLHDPKLLPDFQAATDAILGARERKERIFVHGDYDVDGVSSTALFARFLRRIGCDVTPYVPHRMTEGYGIHPDAVAKAAKGGAKLFLTCDCGVSAHEQLRAAGEAGMAVVVTDHHAVGDTLPDAAAVVNPHREGSAYPWAGLSGAGVVFKLCAGITEELGHKKESYYRAYLDLAVLGTVADVMPLLGENRAITRHGLERLSETKKVGLQALLRVSDLGGKRHLTARDIGFRLGPRINAVGRIEDSATALDLLMTEDETEADALAERMDQLNLERRARQNTMFDEAVAEVEQQGVAGQPAIVIAKEGWHPGIIGIVAGKLVDQFYRPTFVIAIDDEGHARGSARSIAGFHLAEALESAREHLKTGGGHAQAAGFSLDQGSIAAFAAEIRRYAAEMLGPEDFVPRFAVDAAVEGREAGPDALAALRDLEPFGEGNPEPLFMSRGVRLRSVVPTSNPDHARLELEAADGTNYRAMAFGIGRGLAEADTQVPLDVAFTLEESHWNGRAQFRWIVRDYKPSVG